MKPIDPRSMNMDNITQDDIDHAHDKTNDILIKFFGLVHELINDKDETLSPELKYAHLLIIHKACGEAMTSVATELEMKSHGKVYNWIEVTDTIYTLGLSYWQY